MLGMQEILMQFQKSLLDLRASDQNIQCLKPFSIHYDMNKYNVTWRNIVPSLENIHDKENNTDNVETESIEEDISNDLKEFGVDSDAPDLFSSETENSASEDLLSSNEEDEEDDLEIPAFLRRQKN